MRTARLHAPTRGAQRPPPRSAAVAPAVLERLQACGLRLTRHRHAVIEALQSAAGLVLPVDELRRRAQGAGSTIGNASLYRVLHELEDAGIADRRMLPSGRAAFGLHDRRTHHLLACAHCDRTLEFHDADLQAHALRVANDVGGTGCTAQAAPQITVYADCLGCRRGPASTLNPSTTTP